MLRSRPGSRLYRRRGKEKETQTTTNKKNNRKKYVTAVFAPLDEIVWDLGSKAKVNFKFVPTTQSSRKCHQLCMISFIPSTILNVIIDFTFICLIWKPLF